MIGCAGDGGGGIVGTAAATAALADRRAVDGFLRLARHKAEWLSERPAAHRAPKLRGRGTAGGDGE